MENFSHHASTLGCFPTETPVQRVGGIPSGCHGKDWTLRPGLAGTVMAANWTPWDLTVSGQFYLPSERAISLPCTHSAISAWESCPWCPGWTLGLLIFHVVLSDGHWDPLKRCSFSCACYFFCSDGKLHWRLCECFLETRFNFSRFVGTEVIHCVFKF